MQATIQNNSSWVLRASIAPLRGDQHHLKLISLMPSVLNPREHVQFAGTFTKDELCRLQSLIAEAWRRGVKLDYTRPGKPMDNGLIESLNGRLLDEFLNVSESITMQDAREELKA